MSDQLESVTHPELFFGLVGPIGVDMDSIQNRLVDALTQVRYKSEIIHLSNILPTYEKSAAAIKDSTYNEKINRANAFCATAENPAAMAGIAIAEITQRRREIAPGKLIEPITRQAYIIRQLKRSAEIQLLKQAYGPKFIQISVALNREDRIKNLSTTLSLRDPSLTPQSAEKAARELVERDDHETGVKYGQEVGEIFHHADFFVTGSDSTKTAAELIHFIRALFGDNSKSPRKDEVGAYFAASSALRSVDLSRQVGAAIFSPEGDIISVGCNEVPKAGGGSYWIEDTPLYRDFERGAEQNSIEKQRIISDFISRLEDHKLVPSGTNIKSEEGKKLLSDALEDALISDITEYGRMTHAEMAAILDAARLGRSLKGATIYVTTFPCHNCAKHIIAAGITRVVFIEPYPKSRALNSHPDSITLDKNSGALYVKFEHFEGISPLRYKEIFRKEGKRRSGQKLHEWYEGNDPRPRVFPRDNLHIRRETVLAMETLKKLAAKQEEMTSLDAGIDNNVE